MSKKKKKKVNYRISLVPGQNMSVIQDPVRTKRIQKVCRVLSGSKKINGIKSKHEGS